MKNKMNLFEEANILLEIDGTVKEAKKAQYKWSLPERTLNAVVQHINSEYNIWKNWLMWTPTRIPNHWWLYIKPNTEIDKRTKDIVDEIEKFIGLF